MAPLYAICQIQRTQSDTLEDNTINLLLMLGTWASGIILAITVFFTIRHFSIEHGRKVEIVFNWYAKDSFDLLCDEDILFISIRNNGNKPLRIDSIGLYVADARLILLPESIDLIINPNEKDKEINYAEKSQGDLWPLGTVNYNTVLNLALNRQKFEKEIKSFINEQNENLNNKLPHDSVRLMIMGNGKDYISKTITLKKLVTPSEDYSVFEEPIDMPIWKYNKAMVENWKLIVIAYFVIGFLVVLMSSATYSNWDVAVFLFTGILSLLIAKYGSVASHLGDTRPITLKIIGIILFISVFAMFEVTFLSMGSLVEFAVYTAIWALISAFFSYVFYTIMKVNKGLILTHIEETIVANYQQ